MASIKNLSIVTCLILCVAAHSDDIQQKDAPDLRSKQNVKELRSPPTVAYFAVDVALGSDSLETIKTATKTLVQVLSSGKQFAVSSFSGDDSGPGSYLKESVGPSYIGLSKDRIISAIDGLTSSSDSRRNVGAAIRDAIAKLEDQKDNGSVLYLISNYDTIGTELELEIVEALLTNNVQLVAVEIGLSNSLVRLESLAKAVYFNPSTVGNSGEFNAINLAVANFLEESLFIDRQILISETRSITANPVWSGTFQMSSGLGEETVAALHSPLEGSFTVSFSAPDGSTHSLNNNPGSNNWNDPSAIVGLVTTSLPPVVGDWEFTVQYSPCPTSCPDSVSVTLQVTTSSSGDPTGPTTTSRTTTSVASTTTAATTTTSTTTTAATTTTSTTTDASSTIHSSEALILCGFIFFWISRNLN